MSITATRAHDLQQRRERAQQVGYDYERRAGIEVPRCNICGCGDTVTIANSDRYGFAAHFVQCTACGLGWITPRMEFAAYGEFYEHWYRPLLTAWYGREMSAAAIQEDQQLYADAFAEHLQQILEPYHGKTMLDVGGSTGVLARTLRDRYGLVPTVLDPSSDELAFAESAGLATIHSLIEYAPAWMKFDVITMCQTIEHLMNPKAVMQKLRGMLADGGILIFDFVPLEQQLRNTRPIEMVLKIDHLHYFTQYCVTEMLERCHLKIKTFTSFTNRQIHFVCEAA